MLASRDHADASRERDAVHRTVLAAAPAEIAMFDLDGRFLYASPGAIRDAVVRQWVLGRTVEDWCRARGHGPGMAELRARGIAEATVGGAVLSLDEVRTGPLGGRRRFRVLFAPVRGPDGQVTRVVTVAVDAGAVGSAETERNAEALEAGVQQANEALAAAAKGVEEARLAAQGWAALAAHNDAASPMPSPSDALDVLAKGTSPILLRAEPGVPLTAIARTLHARSERASGPFVRIQCSSPDAASVEAILFGEGDVPGAWRLARGGTLYLEGVGALSPSTQDRVLERLQRVDEGRDPEAGSRVVASTVTDLAARVAGGQMRESLHARLSPLALQVAPLRSRPQEIEGLAQRYLAEAASASGRGLRPLTDAEVVDLRAYDWPGNEAELRQVMVRAAAWAQGEKPRVVLPNVYRAPGSRMETPALDLPGTAAQPGRVRTESEMRQSERDNLVAALEASDWKVYGPGGAAALLGIRPTTLASRIKKLGLTPPD